MEASVLTNFAPLNFEMMVEADCSLQTSTAHRQVWFAHVVSERFELAGFQTWGERGPSMEENWMGEPVA